MRKTFKITWASATTNRMWDHIAGYTTCERRIDFYTPDGKFVLLCNNWMVEEE